VSKNTVTYVKFLHDAACQKLLASVNVSRSYSKNNTGTVFLRHGVDNFFRQATSQELNRSEAETLHVSTVW